MGLLGWALLDKEAVMLFPFYTGGKVATPSNTVSETRSFNAFTVTVAGTVSLLSADGSTVLMPAAVGFIYPISGSRINVTGTSATGISILW